MGWYSSKVAIGVVQQDVCCLPKGLVGRCILANLRASPAPIVAEGAEVLLPSTSSGTALSCIHRTALLDGIQRLDDTAEVYSVAPQVVLKELAMMSHIPWMHMESGSDGNYQGVNCFCLNYLPVLTAPWFVSLSCLFSNFKVNSIINCILRAAFRRRLWSVRGQGSHRNLIKVSLEPDFKL